MIIELGIAASIGAIVGFGTCAVLTAGKVANAAEETERAYEGLGREHVAAWEAHKAHTRCADSRNVLLSRIEAIRELLNRPRTIRKGELSAILDGDV